MKIEITRQEVMTIYWTVTSKTRELRELMSQMNAIGLDHSELLEQIKDLERIKSKLENEFI